MSPISAGKLNRRIVIQNPTVTVTADGQRKESFATWKTVFAELLPDSSTERYSAEALRASTIVRFRIRSLAGFDTTYRVVHKSRTYRILGLDDTENNVEMMIRCEELK